MSRVITYGTFDTLHYGHINLLRRARDLGDFLLVALSSDEFNKSKGKEARFSWDRRKLDLEAIRYVDAVIPEERWDQKISDVINNRIDVFAIGDDWLGEFDFLKPFCEVVYIPRTPGVSSTHIKRSVP